MAGANDSDNGAVRAGSEAEIPPAGLMTTDPVAQDLRDLLARYPSFRLQQGRNIKRAAEEWLRGVGVDDVDAESVLRSELTVILSEPLTGRGELLAAGWLLRMRPAHGLSQAQRDLGDRAVGAGSLSAQKVGEGLEKKTASAFLHVAALCLEQWSEQWSAKPLKEPRTAFQSGKDGHTPRTRAVASALAEALDERFNDLSSSPAKLRQRRAVWKKRPQPKLPESKWPMWPRKTFHLVWATPLRRVLASIAVGLAVLTGVIAGLVAAAAFGGPPLLTSTEVVVYRPTIPTMLPEATGSRYFDLTCMESNTSPRRDARLCVTVNLGPVWDPCFEIDAHYVSCPDPALSDRGQAFYVVHDRIRPVLENVERRNYPVDRQLSIDAAVHESRPWAIALKDPLSGGNRVCIAKYDDILSPLPVKFACVKWEARYALDIEALIDGTDRGETLNFTGDSTIVFDLDQSKPVWTVRAPDGPDGVYREVEVAAAYF